MARFTPTMRRVLLTSTSAAGLALLLGPHSIGLAPRLALWGAIIAIGSGLVAAHVVLFWHLPGGSKASADLQAEAVEFVRSVAVVGSLGGLLLVGAGGLIGAIAAME